ncbi:vitamin K epoxide reductase family protein [Microbacterium sp. NPDC080220]|uniref:vitamin K epoxide reductase family protein n=1 Tax=Microbacterium sp. NPDC080220 TaxID=3161017 RepID=UPI00343D0BD9
MTLPPDVVSSTRNSREPVFGLFLVVAGTIGLLAALALSIEKVEKLQNPQEGLSCDFSVLVQCSANLDSPQGAVLGFPNPFLGLIGFALVACVGVATWATPHLSRWFWATFNAGILGAGLFVAWLISQSIYVLGTLCPWCLVVWTVTIPLVIFVTGRNLRRGTFGKRGIALGERAWPWLPLTTIATYTVIAVLAQIRLNVLESLV